MTPLPDITIDRDATGICYRPRTGKADTFLFNAFNTIGLRDLTDEDHCAIVAEAVRRGFVIEKRF